MSRKLEKICDVCGAREEKSNGWFVVTLGSVTIYIQKQSAVDFGPEKDFDVCGSGCAIRKIEELLPRLK